MLKKLFVFIAIIAAISGLGFFWKYKKNGSVNWVNLKRGPIIEAVYGLSTVTSEREFKVKPGFATTIQKIHTREGDTIQKGQPLLQMLEQPVIRAPFEGVVTSIPFKEGENVFPQVPVLSLLDLKNIYLSMNVEQSAALMVRKNQTAIVMFESLRNQKYNATISAIIPKDGQFEVHLSAKNLPEGLLPGMTADTSIVVGEKQNAVLIPVKALSGFTIRFREGEKGSSKKAEVKLGIIADEYAELLEPVFENPENIFVAVP